MFNRALCKKLIFCFDGELFSACSGNDYLKENWEKICKEKGFSTFEELINYLEESRVEPGLYLPKYEDIAIIQEPYYDTVYICGIPEGKVRYTSYGKCKGKNYRLTYFIDKDEHTRGSVNINVSNPDEIEILNDGILDVNYWMGKD